MDEDKVLAYLLDIRDSKLRLNQVDYLIKTFSIDDGIGSPVWDKIGTSYDVGDPVGNGVSKQLTRLAELKEERESLAAKIALYDTWLGFLGDDELYSLVDHVFLQRRSANSFYNDVCPMGRTSYYRRLLRITEVLSQNPISVVTEQEKTIRR